MRSVKKKKKDSDFYLQKSLLSIPPNREGKQQDVLGVGTKCKFKVMFKELFCATVRCHVSGEKWFLGENP